MAEISRVTTVGVLADTHIPDRMFNLHSDIIPIFRDARVDLILHAGDICIPAVIQELEEVAPVSAARGNRDLFFSGLHRTKIMEIAGVSVGLTHGHGNLFQYALQKMKFMRYGYRIEHYLPMLISVMQKASIIIFGHTHRPLNIDFNGKLLFNPGSAGLGWRDEIPPSIGLLHFYKNGSVGGEVIYLKSGYKKK